MDIQMPVMNGYESSKAIRSLSRPDAGQIPIIALTANAFIDDIILARNAGMNEHVSKPVQLEQLAECSTVIFKSRDYPPAPDHLSFTLQNNTPTAVLIRVATMAGPTIPVGFTLPYWLRKAMTFTGINWREEIFKMRKLHMAYSPQGFHD